MGTVSLQELCFSHIDWRTPDTEPSSETESSCQYPCSPSNTYQVGELYTHLGSSPTSFTVILPVPVVLLSRRLRPTPSLQVDKLSESDSQHERLVYFTAGEPARTTTC